MATDPRTLVFFEAPHRVGEALAAMAEVIGVDRPAAVCRELTKTYEEVRRGTLGELAAWAADGLRGEITIVVQGAEPGALPAVAMADGADPRKAALAAVAAAYGLDRGAVYDAVVAAKKASTAGTAEKAMPPRN